MASGHGGDGADVLTISTGSPAAFPVEAFGDEGNDSLTGASGEVILRGGGADDALTPAHPAASWTAGTARIG
jgi:Ca2+-binding RTX toxin-like protein